MTIDKHISNLANLIELQETIILWKHGSVLIFVLLFYVNEQLLALSFNYSLFKNLFKGEKMGGGSVDSVFCNCRCRFICSIAFHALSWYYCIIMDNKNLHRIHLDLFLFFVFLN